MNTLLITGLFFVFIFLFGFWVSRAGKPYNTLLFTIHKLVGLATGIYLIVSIYHAHQAASFSPLEIMVISLTVLIFICLVAAGGLLSIAAEGGLKKASPSTLTVIEQIHKIFPYLAVLATAATLYLLLFQQA